MLLLYFSTGRQIFYTGHPNIQGDPTGTKACAPAADLLDLDGNMHCFMLPEHTAVHVFF